MSILTFDSDNSRLNRKIRVGLPKGNLNKSEQHRGNTSELLEYAGYYVDKYFWGAEKQNPIIRQLKCGFEFYCMKPKQFPVLLEQGILDMAICGRDSIEEYHSRLWYLYNWESKVKDNWDNMSLTQLVKILNKDEENPNIARDEKWQRISECFQRTLTKSVPLGYGRVNIELGVKDLDFLYSKLGKLDLLNISSAYPNLTFAYLSRYFPSSNINIISNNPRNNSLAPNPKLGLINIYPLVSNTENMISLGIGDLVVDSVASGASFRANKLNRIGSPVMTNSVAGLYFSPTFSDYSNPEKYGSLDSRIVEFIEKLKRASVKYAEEGRRDSLYYVPYEERK